MDKKKFQALIERFMRINININQMHSDCITIDGKNALTVGEIHLIECIGKHRESNVTEMAEILGRTKGAVSQMAVKLEKKGLCIKEKHGNNNKEIILSLTQEGQRVFEEHEKLHNDLYRDIASALDEIDEKSFNEIESILGITEKYLDEYKEKYH